MGTLRTPNGKHRLKMVPGLMLFAFQLFWIPIFKDEVQTKILMYKILITLFSYVGCFLNCVLLRRILLAPVTCSVGTKILNRPVNRLWIQSLYWTICCVILSQRHVSWFVNMHEFALCDHASWCHFTFAFIAHEQNIVTFPFRFCSNGKLWFWRQPLLKINILVRRRHEQQYPAVCYYRTGQLLLVLLCC